MTRLCVPIFVESLAQAHRDAALAAEAGADLVEYRIDTLGDAGELKSLVLRSPLPCILTCRPAWEGGHNEADEPQRLALLAAGAESGAAFVDLELDAGRRTPGLMGRVARLMADVENGEPGLPRERPRLVLSSHDFKGRPDKLYTLVEQMNASAGDVNKIAWTARSIRDNQEAFELLRHARKPTIALCMGEAGLTSRVLAKKFGAFLTFASLRDASATAPGQVTIGDLKDLYRWDAITPATRVYGVVGSPVGHSMSPAIHNAAFAGAGFDGVYLPLLVNAGYESFKAFMETFVRTSGPLQLHGLSVTIPHKENCLRYLKEIGPDAEIEPLAKSIGAVNTVTVERNVGGTTLRGSSTDYAAILDSITAKLNLRREELANYRVAVLGAGGAGRTAVAALAHCGATVVVYNRTKERADALAEEFNGRVGKVVSAPMGKLCDSCCHVFINTTSLGMSPNIDASPLDLAGGAPPKFSADTLVFDTVYNPMKTKLLKQAEAAGAKTIGGVEMFVRQAAGQFEAWTNQKAPAELMRGVVERRLGADKRAG